MSSVPPSTPPGGAPPPYPPYDPRMQWRAYRAQQRDAWRAQRDAWKANYVNAYGPRVPSVVGPVILIGAGVVALLIVTGHLAAGQFWAWYGHWWPLLLIGAGLALLAEWALDLHRKTPIRRGGSFVGILILLALLGYGAAKWDKFTPWHGQWDDHDGDLFAFGLPEHDSDQPLLEAQIPLNAAIEVQNPRGDVSVTAGDGATIEVQAHEVAYAGSDADASKIFEAEAPHLTVSGSAVLVKAESNSHGRLNLTIKVPKTARVTVNAGKGDVTAAGLDAGISITAPHGDVHLSAITGSVEAHLANGKHDFSASDIGGNLTADGDSNDLTLSGIKGKVTQNGEILGDVHMEQIAGAIHLHTSVTDLEVAELPGDLTLNSDDLRISEAKGQVRVQTHSKDIDLNQISGDSYVNDRDGRISVEPAGNYAIEARNGKGDVEVTLPPNASASVNARTHNGDIVSDFAIPSSGGENKSVSFRIGSGASRIVLSADNGDVRIKRGSSLLSTPPATKAAKPFAPHLKTSRALPSRPVTQ